MPGLRHDAVVELFRNCGGLALELIGPHAPLPLGEWTSRPLIADFTQPLPTELRADHVTAYYRAGAGDEPPVLAIIVEVQLQIDLDKRWRWAAYLANAVARFRCPVILLVITPDASVAAWARGPFPTGHPSFALEPVVIDLSALPTLLEPQLAHRLPELAVLCALGHPDALTRTAAFNAILHLPSDRVALYLRSAMSFTTPTKSFFADVHQSFGPEMEEKLFQEQLEEVRQQERKRVQKLADLRFEELRQQERERAQQERERAQQEREREQKLATDALRAASLDLLQAKLSVVSPEDEAALGEPSSLTATQALFSAIARARSEDAVRAALAAARAAPRS